jgi:hypothetical protein
MSKKIVLKYLNIPMLVRLFIHFLVALYISTSDCALTYFLLEAGESYSRIDVFLMVFINLFMIHMLFIFYFVEPYSREYDQILFSLKYISRNSSNKLYQIDRKFKNDHEFTSTISMPFDNYVLKCGVGVDGKGLKIFDTQSNTELEYIYRNVTAVKERISDVCFLIFFESRLDIIAEKERAYISKCNFNYLYRGRKSNIKKKGCCDFN